MGPPGRTLSVDPGYGGGSADRQIVRTPLGLGSGEKKPATSCVNGREPPPMSRDMISANLTIQFVPSPGDLGAKRGGAPPGLGALREALAGQAVRPARRHGHGGLSWRMVNPSACDIYQCRMRLVFMQSRWLQCETLGELRVLGVGLWSVPGLVALQLKRKLGGPATQEEEADLD